MAAVAVEHVIQEITLIITEAVEKSVAGVRVVAEGVKSAVSGAVTAATTKAIEDSLNNSLSAKVKEIIGSQGIDDISETAAAIPTDVVIGTLTEDAFHTINPHLKALKDPSFQRFTRLLRALRAAQRGNRPDDDDEEENYRYFESDLTDSLKVKELVLFSVYGIDGDEVYSASAPWAVIQSLVEDPIAGRYVTKLFRELLDTTDTNDEETDMPRLRQGIVTVLALHGTLENFHQITIYNVKGSSQDNRQPNWINFYYSFGYGQIDRPHCYIANEDPICGHTNPLIENIVGGHVWNPTLKHDYPHYYYILPICKRHNKQNKYDVPRPDGSGWLFTDNKAEAVKITSDPRVPYWLQMLNYMKGSVTKMEAAVLPESLKEMSLRSGESRKPTEIPGNIEEWLEQQIETATQEFAKNVIETVLKEVFSIVIGKMGEIIKAAGKEAQDWAQHEGNDVTISRLATLKDDAIGRFHEEARSGIRDYKNKCLEEGEQKSRKQRLLDETNKVIFSQKWKRCLTSIEENLVAALPNLIEKDW